jgi:hypothetical protein
VTTKGTTAMTTINAGEHSQSSDRSGFGWVYGPLAASAISGTIDWQIIGRPNTFDNIYHGTIAVYLVQPDATLRSTLLSASTSDQGTVWTVAAGYVARSKAGQAITSQTPTAGDYLVIELGTIADFLDVDSFDLSIGDVHATLYPYVTFSTTIALQAPTALSYSNDGQSIRYGDAATDMVASVTPSAVQASCTFAITSGALPSGVSLNTTTGTISGTPTATGSFTFVVTATNSGGSVASSSLTMGVRLTGGSISMNISI